MRGNNMSRYKTRAAIGMLVAAMAIGGPAMAKDRDPGQDRGSRLKTVRVSGSSDVDLRAATNVSVKCLPSGTCLVIGYNTSLLTGDISGNLTYGFVVSQSAQGGSFNTGQYEVTGTVKGCGTGTFVVAYRPTYLDRDRKSVV